MFSRTFNFTKRVCSSLPIIFQGKYAEAEPLYRRSLAINERVYGPDHQEVATDLNNWASGVKEPGESQNDASRSFKTELFLRN